MESHIFEICVVIATLVFIVIGIYLVMTLKTLIESLKHLNASLSKLENRIDPISTETIRLLENSNEIAESLQDKLSDLDPLMGSISNVGESLQSMTSSFSSSATPFKFFQTQTKKKREWQDTVGDLIELATLGVSAWQKFKKEQ
jgi:uncharacterized protein YoxC